MKCSARLHLFTWIGLVGIQMLALAPQAPALNAAAEATAPAANPLPLLTNIAQIRALSRSEAQRGYPVRLQAVVTFHNHYRLCFVQDSTGAIFVQRGKKGSSLTSGQRVEFEGLTQAGDYAPILVETNSRVLGPGKMPSPRPASFDELASGESDCQWVEVHGIVRSARDIPGSHLELELAVGGGKMRVQIYEYPEKGFERLVDASIRLRGAAGSIFNLKKQFVAPFLFVSGRTNVSIEEPAPKDPFSASVRTATSLLQYIPGASYGHRVKVSGVVTHEDPGQAVFLRDGAQGLELDTHSTNHVKIGDRIEAIGFPVMGRYTPKLEDSVFRTVGEAASPEAFQTSVGQVLTGGHDADLITVDAQLLDVVRRGIEWILVLQAEDVIFNAHLSQPAPNPPPLNLEKGSRLRVTGICLIQEAKERVARLTPQSFRILLRAPEDIVVLQKPSWWTFARLLWTLAIMALVLLLGLAWVVVLNRRVRHQTEIIQQKVQREAILEERTRIAREFHDTLEQELAAITIQLNTVAAQFDNSPDTARRQLDLARTMSRRSMIEARRSVWDLRSHLLENRDLPAALREMAAPLAENCGAKIELATTGPARKFPADLENNLLRVAQEALANAVKHSQARNIHVELQYDPRKVRLLVRDDGCGFEVNDHLALGGGHFGLLDMRERAEKFGGSFSLVSNPGSGTQIVVEIRDKTSPGSASAAPAASGNSKGEDI